jgi:hypothetical protein
MKVQTADADCFESQLRSRKERNGTQFNLSKWNAVAARDMTNSDALSRFWCSSIKSAISTQ